MTRADFTRTTVTDPSITGQSNSMPTKCLLSTPKEVFTSKIYFKPYAISYTSWMLTNILTLFMKTRTAIVKQPFDRKRITLDKQL